MASPTPWQNFSLMKVVIWAYAIPALVLGAFHDYRHFIASPQKARPDEHYLEENAERTITTPNPMATTTVDTYTSPLRSSQPPSINQFMSTFRIEAGECILKAVTTGHRTSYKWVPKVLNEQTQGLGSLASPETEVRLLPETNIKPIEEPFLFEPAPRPAAAARRNQRSFIRERQVKERGEGNLESNISSMVFKMTVDPSAPSGPFSGPPPMSQFVSEFHHGECSEECALEAISMKRTPYKWGRVRKEDQYKKGPASSTSQETEADHLCESENFLITKSTLTSSPPGPDLLLPFQILMELPTPKTQEDIITVLIMIQQARVDRARFLISKDPSRSQILPPHACLLLQKVEEKFGNLLQSLHDVTVVKLVEIEQEIGAAEAAATKLGLEIRDHQVIDLTAENNSRKSYGGVKRFREQVNDPVTKKFKSK